MILGLKGVYDFNSHFYFGKAQNLTVRAILDEWATCNWMGSLSWKRLMLAALLAFPCDYRWGNLSFEFDETLDKYPNRAPSGWLR